MNVSVRFAGLVFALFCVPSLALAEEDVAYSDLKRIKLSLQKEALVLKMTHAACYALGGLNPERKKDLALDLMANYGTTLDTFREGASSLGVLPETETEILNQVDALEEVWENYSRAMEQVVSGNHHALIVEQMLDSYSDLAVASNALAINFIEHYGGDALGEEIGQALQVSARHAMLSQRMVKEMCYVYFGVGGQTMAFHLRKTIEAVEAGFLTLIDGDETLSPPTNDRVEENLRMAQQLWMDVKKVAENLTKGASTNGDQIAAALEQNIKVLQHLQRAKEGYLFEG